MRCNDAGAAARRSFGNVTAAEERFYESRRWLWWDEFPRDTRYALRSLNRHRAFTIAVVPTLAPGIGANTAIFSVIDSSLLRPLPYPGADRIVSFYTRGNDGDTDRLAPAD